MSAGRIRSPLALFGGPASFSSSWPSWPAATPEIVAALQSVAESGRWAISGAFTGMRSHEQQFADAFAAYNGTRYAVPTVNGSAALTIGLEALRIGVGDEVLVPGLTWVACASAVSGIGAVPVLVDVDPQTLCISADAARAAITPRTAAIMVVHAYCSAADLDAFTALSATTGIPLIEDCSQAHGARWRGLRVGTYGVLGAFSLQQVKVLTCGEGGVAITANPELDDTMQQLRADGRRRIAVPRRGQLELEDIGSVQGRNYCLSEFHAAVALAQLPLLDQQNARRRVNAARLRVRLREIPGVLCVEPPAALTEETIYQFVIQFDPERLGPLPTRRVADALFAELGVFVEMIDAPLNANRLYNPLASRRLPLDERSRRAFDPHRFDLPAATRAQQNSVAFGHWALLGSSKHTDAIAEAVAKVVENLDDLRSA